jgi:hypothetical protein
VSGNSLCINSRTTRAIWNCSYGYEGNL